MFTNRPSCTDVITAEYAADLLSQQVWCWGCDITRPDGNWLIESGFDRIAPPADRAEASSVYQLNLPSQCHLVLRGFGVFIGAAGLGGIFIPRYHFRPRYTTETKLPRPPWAPTDLPNLNSPNFAQKDACSTLVLKLIDWICQYEQNVVERLGIDYRRLTLTQWDDGCRRCVPAEDVVCAWRELADHLSRDWTICFEETP